MFRAPAAGQLRIPIEDRSSVAEARRQAAALARACQFEETVAGELALAVTEAATNIVKHAQRGELLVRGLGAGGAGGIEVMALDKGPGIANLAESLRDGHSTAGSPGTGLGALQRMTSAFEIYSRPGSGTVLRFEVWQRPAPRRAQSAGVVCLPKEGETACGDGWAILERPQVQVLFVVDGLGHGADAAAAARAAVGVVAKHANRTPTDILGAVDAALRSTRGAAASVAVLQPALGLCTYCGVGNIAASIHVNGSARSMVSHNGILGHQVRKIQEFQYPFPRGALCVVHSDGLATRWSLGAYTGLELRHPGLIAAVLYRDHSRLRDDVTAVAVRNAQ